MGSCVDEEIVYREGPNFVTPPASAANFVGYSDQASSRTVCGSCHISAQARWQETAHADAFATLEGSGHMQGSCQRCHTVNDQGNAVTDTVAGWRGTKDTRYHDVQCESCHGPGLQHVTSPQRGQMLPSIHADTGSGVTNGCAECHSGTHHPFVEEWRKTRHATSYTRAYGGGTLNPSCQGCHVGQKVLANWGVNTNYVEKDLGQTVATGEGVTCVVCHDPHNAANPNQLRYPVDSRDPENNLCARCHSRRSNPDFTGNRDSPHAPHGPLIFGTAGWFPPGVEFEETESSHGSERNPKLCAGCHVQNYAVTDQATGNFQVQVVGHRFLAIPCVDANGAPTDDQNCQLAQRSFRSCSASGCHTESTARSALASAESDIALLTGHLDNMLAQVPASEKLPAASGKVTVARGATFNSNLAKSHGAEVHNPFLVKALLRASITAVSQQYNIPAPPGLSLAPYDQMNLRMNPQ
ncbi:MAG TPA: multiheme c-type cytochrome [Gemmatimonadaceae bacterium]|nr:multiheme c-type cytochrome [Gemmatimonadaceae bacterium]